MRAVHPRQSLYNLQLLETTHRANDVQRSSMRVVVEKLEWPPNRSQGENFDWVTGLRSPERVMGVCVYMSTISVYSR